MSRTMSWKFICNRRWARRIKSGAQLDARAAWRLTAALSAFVAAENLTDASLQTGRSATGVVTYDAPREVRVGLALRR